ncbi:MAG: NAD(P)H-hydrate dehydratase [Candidatus Omnitrophica bacterium]|nr:NAD(P)H-hydrate dehydratase [Candidatus Omnitrophota bacterium]
MRLPTRLLRRSPEKHKGDFGHVFILGGSVNFSGAAILAGAAAMRSGAGLVTLGIPRSLCGALIKIKPLELMLKPLAETPEKTVSVSAFRQTADFIKNVDVLVVGPGLTRNKSTQGLIRKIVKACDRPMVIDADGLNALAGHLDVLRAGRHTPRAMVITPHPGEMAGLLGVSVKKVLANRETIAKRFALDYNLTVVLKGHNTVVAGSKGELFINKTGNPGMASAGTGDVLAGMTAAFLGQGLGAFEAGKFAVYLHGLAGDLAAGEKTQLGLIASDIIAKIPEAVKRCS